MSVDLFEIGQVARESGSIDAIRSAFQELRSHSAGAAQRDRRLSQPELSSRHPRQFALECLYAKVAVDHHDESGKAYWLAVDFFQPQAGRWVSEIAGMAVSVPSAGHG